MLGESARHARVLAGMLSRITPYNRQVRVDSVARPASHLYRQT